MIFILCTLLAVALALGCGVAGYRLGWTDGRLHERQENAFIILDRIYKSIEAQRTKS
jgi:hypothetical protein